MGRRALAIAALAAGCTRPALVTPPPIATDRGWLLVAEHDRAAPQLFAFEGRAEPLILDFDLEPRRLFALEYRCPLGDLALTAGAIPLGEAGARPLPAPAAVAALDLGGGAWQAQQELPVHLASLRLDRPAFDLCAALSVEPLLLPDTTGDEVRLLLPLGPEAALAATEQGRFFRVERGAVEVLPIEPTWPRGGGLVQDDGTIWLVDALGSVARGTIEVGFTWTTTSASAVENSVAVAGDRRAGTRELWVQSRGRLGRFDGQRVVPVVVGEGDRDVEPSLIWLGPEHLLSIGASGRDLLLIQGAERTRIPGPPAAPLQALESVPGHGLLAGDDLGGLYRFEDGALVAVDQGVYRLALLFFAAFDGGYLFGGSNGQVAQYFPDAGFCPPNPIANLLGASLAVAHGDGVLLGGSQRRTGPAVLYWLARSDRDREFRACSGR